MTRPMTVLREEITQPGRDARSLTAWAVAQPLGPAQPNRDPLLEAHMLVTAANPGSDPDPLPVGVTCRICPRDPCIARREPSILGRPG